MEDIDEDLQDTTSQSVTTSRHNKNNNINNIHSNQTSSGHEAQKAEEPNKTQVIASIRKTFVGTTSIDRGDRGVGSVDDVPSVEGGSAKRRTSWRKTTQLRYRVTVVQLRNRASVVQLQCRPTEVQSHVLGRRSWIQH